jgi:hypothetical protein
MVVIEVVKKSVEGVFDNGPVGPIEAGPKAIRARACILVHLMKGIEDFLMGEGIIEVSELRCLLWIDIREMEVPGVWSACAE